MNIFSVENLTKSYGENPLFQNLTFGLEEGKKAAVVGLNGSGKTTLLQVLSGEESPDQGQVTFGNHVVVEYMSQNPVLDPSLTVLEQIFDGNSPELDLIRDYEKTVDDLSRDDASPVLQDRIHRLAGEMDRRNLWTLEAEAKSILNQLGIIRYDQLISELSGGALKRVSLARALIRPAHLLIMDEPTNHLDSETIDWLEKILSQKKTTLLMVTHDRYFLDRVTDVIFELSGGELHRYDGNFTTYLEERTKRDQDRRQLNEKRKKLLKSELQWMRSGVQGRGTRQKARVERFAALQEQITIGTDRELTLEFRQARLGKKILILENVSKQFDHMLIRDLSYEFSKGDRIGIIGKNGTGKTTLLDLMAGYISPDQGRVIPGETLKIGYFRQNNELLNPEDTLLSYLEADHHYILDQRGRDVTAGSLLERFLFPRNRHWQKIATLSGGERRRLYLLKILMEAPNMLLLDEPTNDLDLDTLMVLEEFLDQFEGVLVTVSHDRYFLNKVADQMFVFEGGGKVSRYPGHYDDVQRRREEEQREATQLRSGPGTGKETRSPVRRKMTYSEKMEYESIEGEIESLEQALAEAQETCARCASEYEALRNASEQKDELDRLLEAKLERWAWLAGKAEEGEDSGNG